jgi:hypothetical protein
MLKLYFGNVPTIISTLLAAAFAVFFALVTAHRASITNWGILTLVVFFLGLAMSILSGVKDGVGTIASIIPAKHWVMIVLSILGGLCFLSGLLAIIIRNRAFWQVSFYLLSSLIIVKVLLTESFRIVEYLSK